MAVRVGQSEKMTWAEMAKRHSKRVGTEWEKWGWGCRGREDVAVDVMTIVGSVLWGGPTFLFSGLKPGERRYDDNQF